MSHEKEKRQHRRIEKRATVLFALPDDSYNKKWDMCLIENISAGGVKFAVPVDMPLNGKTIHLQIKLPELAPDYLTLEAFVLSSEARPNSKVCDIRAKFINLSQKDKEQLSIIEKIIDLQAKKRNR